MPRLYLIVPFTVEFVALDLDLRQLFIRDLDTRLVEFLV